MKFPQEIKDFDLQKGFTRSEHFFSILYNEYVQIL